MQNGSSPKRFVVKNSNLNTSKLFVEFHLPSHRAFLDRLRQGPYSLYSLKELSARMFDGPFGSDRTVDMYQESGIPFIRVKDVLPEGINTEELKFISREKHETISRSRVVPGDVLMTIAGRLGTAAVFPESLVEGNITGHIVGIEPRTLVDPHYLAIFINSRFGVMQANLWGHRTTRPELNLHEIGQFAISVPPTHVQKYVIQVIQNAYELRKKQREQSYQLLAGIEDEILNFLGIRSDLLKNNFNRRFVVKPSSLHRTDVRYFSPFYTELQNLVESGTYPTQPLGSLCEKLTNGLTPARAAYTETGYGVIKVASLTKDWWIDWTKVAFTSKQFFEKASRAYIRDGDLLILSASHQLDYIGRNFAIVRDIPQHLAQKCMTVGELIIVRAKQQLVLPEYLLACLITTPVQELINRMTRGQSAHLYAEDLSKLCIPVPPLEIQRLIMEKLNQRRLKSLRLRTDAETLVYETRLLVEQIISGEKAIL